LGDHSGVIWENMQEEEKVKTDCREREGFNGVVPIVFRELKESAWRLKAEHRGTETQGPAPRHEGDSTTVTAPSPVSLGKIPNLTGRCPLGPLQREQRMRPAMGVSRVGKEEGGCKKTRHFQMTPHVGKRNSALAPKLKQEELLPPLSGKRENGKEVSHWFGKRGRKEKNQKGEFGNRSGE